MVYIFDEIDSFTDKEYEMYTPLLSDERIVKRDSLIKPDRITNMLAYLLLRFALFDEYGITKMPVFKYGNGNKPYFDPDIRFNLSHCRKAVMCGVTEGELGVDVQEWTDEEIQISDMVMTESEMAEIRTDTSGKRFFDIWTLKESYGKMLSLGILYDLKSVSFNGIGEEWTKRYEHLFVCGRRKDYSYSVCADRKLTVRFLSLCEFRNVLDHLLCEHSPVVDLQQ